MLWINPCENGPVMIFSQMEVKVNSPRGRRYRMIWICLRICQIIPGMYPIISNFLWLYYKFPRHICLNPIKQRNISFNKNLNKAAVTLFGLSLECTHEISTHSIHSQGKRSSVGELGHKWRLSRKLIVAGMVAKQLP